MKIRTDFVTNSSSSSFIIVGKHVDINEVDLSNGKYLFIGKELCDGQDIMEINNETLAYLKSHISSNWGDMMLGDSYIFIVKYFAKRYSEDNDCTFTIRELKKCLDENEPFEIISVEKDYHGSENVEDLRDKY